MPEFVPVATVADMPPGTGRTVEVQGVWIALFNVGGSFYAVDNTCPHAGGPLGEGHLEGHVIECPWHGWQYRPADGQSPPPFQEKLPTHRVRVADGRVWVDPRPQAPGTALEPAQILEQTHE